MPIKISINVSKIDKAQLYEGKNGKFFNLVLWETPDDQYGNDFRCVQDVGKEERQAGKKGAILGNGKNFGNFTGKPKERKEAPPQRREVDPDLDAAEDGDSSIPF